jgi:hypothetical protein
MKTKICEICSIAAIQCLGSNHNREKFGLSILLRKNQNHCLSINTEALGRQTTLKHFLSIIFKINHPVVSHFSQTKLYTNEILKLFLLLFVIQTQAQQGGMWIPSLLKGMNETEMKNLA